MSISGTLNTVMQAALEQNEALHHRWIRAINKMAWMFGTGLLTMSADSRIDLLLRAIEAETKARLDEPNGGVPLLDDLQTKLSETWVLSVYEGLRSACEQAKARELDYTGLKQLRDRFALVRMPLAKYEPAWADRLKPQIHLSKIGDEPETPPTLYAPDATYIIPRAMAYTNGSIEWHAVDLREKEMVWINRQELADSILNTFD